MNLKTFGLLASVTLYVAGAGPSGAADKPPEAVIAAAVADASRPEADTKRDAQRKPAAMAAFAEVGPGSKVGELVPGGGYFTRVFAKTVGAKGKVYAIVSPPRPGGPDRTAAVKALAADPAYTNVQVVETAYLDMKVPEPLDVVWTSQNYHDLHNKGLNLDVVAINKQVLKVLKPGGLFVVLDHAAVEGSALRDVDALHRIDPATVKEELLAAGFEYVGESKELRNASDDKSKGVFDASLRGNTDQFVYKFRKPIK
jgi:predicted methyltransferase